MVRADCGYANEEQIQSLEQQGIECIVPFQEESTVKKIERENGITFLTSTLFKRMILNHHNINVV